MSDKSKTRILLFFWLGEKKNELSKSQKYVEGEGGGGSRALYVVV